jgi:hypothetical protein
VKPVIVRTPESDRFKLTLESLVGPFGAAFAGQSSGTVAVSTPTVLDWAAAVSEQAGISGTDTFTCEKAGVYVVSGYVSWTSGTPPVPATRSVEVLKNGFAMGYGAGGANVDSFCIVTRLAVGDTLAVRAVWTTGGAGGDWAGRIQIYQLVA